MRTDPLPEYQAEAALPVLSFETIDAMLRHEAKEHGLTLHHAHGRSTWCRMELGEFGARRGPRGVILYARAHSRDGLFALQDALGTHLAALMPEQAAQLRWQGGEAEGTLPPNFSLARLHSVRPVGAHFLRIRLEGEDLDRLARDMIHFRLVLPPPGEGVPQWPVVGANGQTCWPSGAAALHRPAYTVRQIDAQAGWLETDVFIHAGGRICDWAQSAAPGTICGLNGPGGGGVPCASQILIGGDETAYPALARIIAAQAPNNHGACWLFGASADYDWPAHPGIEMTHCPGGEADLAQRLTRRGSRAKKFWFATEKSRLKPLRAAILDGLGIARGDAHLAAYWVA